MNRYDPNEGAWERHGVPSASNSGLNVAVAVQALEILGGKERDALAIAGGLAARGHCVTILTRSARLDAPKDVTVRSIAAGGWSNHVRARRFAEAVAALRGQFDALLTFDRIADADAYYAADVCFAPRARGLHALMPRYATYARLEAACFASGGPDILFLCRKQEREYRRYYDLDAGRISILPPMLHPSAGKDFYEARATVRKRFDIPESSPLAVSVAVYPEQKGVDRTIAALQHIPDLHLLAVGLKDTATMHALARQHDVASRTRLYGYTHEVADILGSADLMLHPARVENTGLVIVESLMAGTPVIASAACGFAEYIERFDAGAVVAEPFDAQQFLAAIRTAIDPPRLAELKRHARDSAPLLNAEGGLERILDAIEQVLARRIADAAARRRSDR